MSQESSPIRIDVWSDFNCPWCRLAAASLEALGQSHAIDVHWRSYELRPRGAPPISADYRARIEESRPRLNQMARDLYGVEMNPGPFGIDSRPALIGAKFAEANGRGATYHTRIMRAYWQEAQDIGDRATLIALAEEAGLDGAAFAAALDDPSLAQQVDDDIHLAARYGLNGVPALVFENKYLISGAQPPDVLRRVVDQIRAVPAE